MPVRVPVHGAVVAGNTAADTVVPGRTWDAATHAPASLKIGPIAPGASGSYQFNKPGDYFYNDCAGFPWNTGEIIVI